MDIFIKISILLAILGLCHGQVITRGGCPKVDVHPNFDLKQYIGKWYEFEKFFAIFQAFSECTTAEYTLQPFDMVTVNNTGFSDLYSGRSNAIGQAKVMSTTEPAKLGVKFYEGQPFGDYWVLSTDYNTYSLVWSCFDVSLGFLGKLNTQLAWILSRSPDGVPESKKRELYTMMDNYGIDTKRLSATRQTNCPGR